MIAEFVLADGTTIDFECDDTVASSWTSREILRGETYPIVPFIDDVAVVLDIGANCGAASRHFAHAYPDARIHAFEPGTESRGKLTRNVADFPAVTVHSIGLHSRDQQATLYPGREDSGWSSIIPGEFTETEGETITLRSAIDWVGEQGIDRIDIIKLDAEGVEPEILSSLAPRLGSVRVIYVEYGSRADRRRIDAILEPTHELFIGKSFLDQGELLYLSKAAADDERAAETLREVFTAALRATRDK